MSPLTQKSTATPVPKILDVSNAIKSYDSDDDFYNSIDWGSMLAKGFDYIAQDGVYYHLNKWGLGDQIQLAEIAPHNSPYRVCQM